MKSDKVDQINFEVIRFFIYLNLYHFGNILWIDCEI